MQLDLSCICNTVPTMPIIAMSDLRKCMRADLSFSSEIFGFCVACCPPTLHHPKNCCNITEFKIILKKNLY